MKGQPKDPPKINQGTNQRTKKITNYIHREGNIWALNVHEDEFLNIHKVFF